MCTMRVILCLALLATCAMCTTSTGKFSTCCTKVSSAKTDEVIENFIMQKRDDPCVDAVMFITNTGKILCSNPNTRWVKLKIQELKKRNMKANNAEKED